MASAEPATDSRNGPAKQGVAARSINRSVQTQRYDPHRSLTSVRNSMGRFHRQVRAGGGFGGGVVRPDLRRERDQASTNGARSPTTTGKVERWHKTIRAEFLGGTIGGTPPWPSCSRRWMPGSSTTTANGRTRRWGCGHPSRGSGSLPAVPLSRQCLNPVPSRPSQAGGGAGHPDRAAARGAAVGGPARPDLA